MFKIKKTMGKWRTERNWASHIPARMPWRDVDEICKGPGGSGVDGLGIDDFESEPYVGKLAWVRREAIVESEQEVEEPLRRGSRSECKSTVDVMVDIFDGLEHVLPVAEKDIERSWRGRRWYASLYSCMVRSTNDENLKAPNAKTWVRSQSLWSTGEE